MNKEQQKMLVAAWEKSNKILREIRDLAEQNTTLAYGLIRSAETMVDLIAVGKAEEAAKVKQPVRIK